MANAKWVGIIAGIAVVVIIGIILAQSVETPSIPQETAIIEEESTVDITESVVVNQVNENFFINEDGTKTYVISVEDIPEISD